MQDVPKGETPDSAPYIYEVVSPNTVNVASVKYTVFNGDKEIKSEVSKPDQTFIIEGFGTSVKLEFTPVDEDSPYSVGRVFATICKGKVQINNSKVVRSFKKRIANV